MIEGETISVTTDPNRTGEQETIMEDTQLLVLGNGFDLQCGLKSTFNDFEETRLTELTEMGTIFDAGKQIPYTNTPGPDGNPMNGNRSVDWFWNNKFTLWDLILKKEQQADTWYDIEDCINKWIKNIKDKMEDDVLDRYSQTMLRNRYPDSPTALLFWNQNIKQAIKEYATNVYKWNGDIERLLQILLSELQRYEKAFAAYLEEQIRKSSTYESASRELICKLVVDQFDPSLFHPESQYRGDPIWERGTSILDFNYTNPLNEREDESEQNEHKPLVFNVHGKAVDGNIIFGIDGTGVDTHLSLYREIVKFTKTYRLMKLSSNPHPQLVQPYVAGTNLHGTEYIKFFGHSLGEADYSYFQAIFDEVDLYESQTHLIFYYNTKRRNGKKGSGKNAAEEMFEKVNHLISRYGETLDNKDHGKNLLHKLLLEGRLNVLQAPL